MKLGMIGVGQAGGRIVDTFLDYDHRTPGEFVTGAVAINTATTDLAGLENIPERYRVLVGQTRVKGHGVGADNDLGADVMEQDIREVQSAIDEMPIHQVDAFVIVAALGGGTGSGGAPVIARNLKRIYAEPVYTLAILPASDEGGIYSLNAARSLPSVTRESDNVLVFDNDAWRKAGETIERGYDRLNDELVRRFGVLFSAGEITAGEGVAQNVVDSSEIVNTLAAGGISSVGYARADIETRGLLDRFRLDDGETEDTAARTNRITSLVRQAVRGRLTLPCHVASAERVLLVASGPPDRLDRKGIEYARSWLEEHTDSLEVRAGDYPLPNEDGVATAVMVSGVTDAPRIKNLQQVGKETQNVMAENREETKRDTEDLVTDDTDDLSPVY